MNKPLRIVVALFIATLAVLLMLASSCAPAGTEPIQHALTEGLASYGYWPTHTLEMPAPGSPYSIWWEMDRPEHKKMTITEVVILNNDFLVDYIHNYEAPGASPLTKRNMIIAICKFAHDYRPAAVYVTVTQWVNSHGGCPSPLVTNQTPLGAVDADNQALFEAIELHAQLAVSSTVLPISKQQVRQFEWICAVAKLMQPEDVDTYVVGFIAEQGGCP